MQHSHWF